MVFGRGNLTSMTFLSLSTSRFGLAESRGPPRPGQPPHLVLCLGGLGGGCARRRRAVAGVCGVVGGALHAAAHRAPAHRPGAQLGRQRLGARRQAGAPPLRHRRPRQRVGESSQEIGGKQRKIVPHWLEKEDNKHGRFVPFVAWPNGGVFRNCLFD